MFTLRRVSSDGIQMNQELGSNYTLIKLDSNLQSFKRSFKAYFGRDYERDISEGLNKDVYAFIGNGPVLQPLYEYQKNFIMTEGGKTFDNVSYGSYS